MDRAHHIRQKVIDVFRLIMKGMLEEKNIHRVSSIFYSFFMCMVPDSLQRFKLNIKKLLVTQQKSCLRNQAVDHHRFSPLKRLVLR
jgi:hypothetical protein